MKDDDNRMKHPRKHGIDISTIRSERSARDSARQTVLTERQSERFKLPETPGYYIPFQGYGATNLSALPVAATGLMIAPVHKDVTLLLWTMLFYSPVAQSGVNLWTFNLINDALGVMATRTSIAAVVAGTWTKLPPISIFTNDGLIAETSKYIYMDAAPTGAPGSCSLATSVYAV